jgi:hypothetical protein
MDFIDSGALTEPSFYHKTLYGLGRLTVKSGMTKKAFSPMYQSPGEVNAEAVAS